MGCYNKRKKALEFQDEDHVFLRVTIMIKVGRALKSRKLTPQLIGPYQILKRVGKVVYWVVLPPSLSNFHSVFHVSQLWKYIHGPSHVIHLDDVQVRESLTVETSSLWIEDQEAKHLRGKEITLVKVVWGRPVEGSTTWEMKSRMRESGLELFPSDNFREQKFFKRGRIATPQFLII